MATRGNRDVRLGVEIETTGEEGIRRLSDDVRALAKAGGDAAPQFALLAAQLDNLAEQSASTAALNTLNQQVEILAQQQREAAQAADQVSARYVEQRAAVDQLRAAQEDAAEAVRRGRIELKEAEAALRNYTAGQDKDTRATAAYRDQVQALTAAIGDQKVQLASKSAELDRGRQPLQQAVAAERELALQAERTATAARTSAVALRERTSALTQAQSVALAAGVETERLADAEEQIVAAVRETVTATNKLVAERKALSAATEAQAAIDTQLTGVIERQNRAMLDAAAGYEAEQAALRESAEAARRKSQADFDAAESLDDFTQAQNRAKVAVESELAALRDSEAFIRRYAAAQREAAEAADRLAAAEGAEAIRQLERAAASADKEFRELIQSEVALAAAVERTAAEQLRRSAASTEQAEADRLAAIQARGLAEAQERGRIAAESELAAIRESEQFIRRYNQAKAEAIQRTRELIAASGESIDKAFGTTGVRSIQAIEAEIDDVNQAVSRLQAEFFAGRRSLADFERAAAAAQARIAALGREIQTIPGTTSTFGRLADGINNVITRFGALSAAIATVGFAAKPVLDATIALDQMRRVLTTVSGSAEEAANQIEFVRRVAQASGQQFTEVGASYAKFAASALQSGLTLEDTQAVFQSVALAAGNLGLSSDQAKRALEALSQIASKGVVSMEELRQQLGDALPGVLPLLAKELGLTQGELNKVVESGQLLAFEAIPAIGRALTALGPKSGDVEGITASFNRFLNVIKQAGTTLLEGPLGQAGGRLLQGLGFVIAGLGDVAVVTSARVEQLGKSIGAFAGFAASGFRDIDLFKESIKEFGDEATETIESYRTTAFGGAQATNELAKAGAAAGGSFAKLALEQQRSLDVAELNTRVSDKLAQAIETEARSIEQVEAALLDEREALELRATTALRVAAAREAVAKAAEEETATLRANRAAAIEEATSRGQSLDTIKQYLAALDDKIAKGEADVAQARAQATATREAANAAALAAEKYGDQSGKLAELREEVVGAQRAYDAMQRAFSRGKATTDDLTKASAALAIAKNKLRDAVDDLSDALDRELGLLQSENAVKRASIELDLARLRDQQALAVARGNDITARQIGNRISELEIELAKSKNQLTLDEIKLQLDALRAEEDALRSSGELSAQKEAEIRTRRNNLIAKTLETQASVEGVQAQERDAQAVKNGTAVRDANTGSVRNNTSSLSGNSGSLRENTGDLDDNRKATDAATTARERYNKLLRDDPSRLVGGNGLGGITSPGLTGVAGPGGEINGGTSGSVLGPTGSSDFGVDLQVPVPPGYYYTLNGSDPNVERSAGYDPLGRPYGGYFAKQPGYRPPNANAPGVGPFGGTAGARPAPAPAPAPRPPVSAPPAMAITDASLVRVELTIGGATTSGYATQSLIDALKEAERQLGGP